MVDITSLSCRRCAGRSRRSRSRSTPNSSRSSPCSSSRSSSGSPPPATTACRSTSSTPTTTAPRRSPGTRRGFTDRSHFETVEALLWMYGPWFQMLVGVRRSRSVSAIRSPSRHALTFAVGLAGLAAVVPIARLTIGRWAGLAALVLCLLTGYRLRQPVLRHHRRAVPVRHELVDAGDHRDGARRRAALGRHRHGRPVHRARHRHPHRRRHHPRLSRRRDERCARSTPCCARAAARPRAAAHRRAHALVAVAIAWVGRHRAVAVAADRQSVHAVRRRLRAFRRRSTPRSNFSTGAATPSPTTCRGGTSAARLLVRLPEGFLLLLAIAHRGSASPPAAHGRARRRRLAPPRHRRPCARPASRWRRCARRSWSSPSPPSAPRSS